MCIIILGISWATHGQIEWLSSTAPKEQMLVSSEVILDLAKQQKH